MSQAPDDTEEPADDPGVTYTAGKRGPDREDMVASYLPEQEDWLAKTVLEVNDPGRIAALREFETIFPEVGDLQPVIDEFLDRFLKGKTSIAGASRSEYQDIFMSMYGGNNKESKKAGQMLADAFAADLDDD